MHVCVVCDGFTSQHNSNFNVGTGGLSLSETYFGDGRAETVYTT